MGWLRAVEDAYCLAQIALPIKASINDNNAQIGLGVSGGILVHYNGSDVLLRALKLVDDLGTRLMLMPHRLYFGWDFEPESQTSGKLNIT